MRQSRPSHVIPDGVIRAEAMANADPTVEVCRLCGESRERVDFYQASCTPPEEYRNGMPGPAREHEFVRVSLDDAMVTGQLPIDDQLPDAFDASVFVDDFSRAMAASFRPVLRAAWRVS